MIIALRGISPVEIGIGDTGTGQTRPCIIECCVPDLKRKIGVIELETTGNRKAIVKEMCNCWPALLLHQPSRITEAYTVTLAQCINPFGRTIFGCPAVNKAIGA